MTASVRGLSPCNTEACGYRDLRTILLSWSVRTVRPAFGAQDAPAG